MDYEKWEFHDVTPVYLQLYDKLRYGILGGKLSPGEHLPSIREMAAVLHINPNTVEKAYQLIRRQGLIACTRGKGYHVTADSFLIQKERHEQASDFSCTYIRKMLELGFNKQEAIDFLSRYSQKVK